MRAAVDAIELHALVREEQLHERPAIRRFAFAGEAGRQRPVAGTAQSTSKRAVESKEAPKAIGPYSQAIVANGFVFAAGQIGIDPKTGTLADGIEAQVEQTLKNISEVLNASASSMGEVVKTTVFLADINDFAKMNEIYAKHFKAPFPARSTVQVARLPRDARVEIEVIAIRRK